MRFKMESLQNDLHMVKSGVWVASMNLKDAYYFDLRNTKNI